MFPRKTYLTVLFYDLYISYSAIYILIMQKLYPLKDDTSKLNLVTFVINFPTKAGVNSNKTQ